MQGVRVLAPSASSTVCLVVSADDAVVSLDEEVLAVVLLAPSNGCAGPAVPG